MIKLPEDKKYRLPLVDPIPQEQRRIFTEIIAIIRRTYIQVAQAVNTNSVSETSADSIPTLEIGEMRVWKDTDATATNPTHYLIYKDANGDVVTFASEEVVT